MLKYSLCKFKLNEKKSIFVGSHVVTYLMFTYNIKTSDTFFVELMLMNDCKENLHSHFI